MKFNSGRDEVDSVLAYYAEGPGINPGCRQQLEE